jgi:hypothetical protein
VRYDVFSYLINTETGMKFANLSGCTAAQFSSDGNLLAVGRGDGGIEIWRRVHDDSLGPPWTDYRFWIANLLLVVLTINYSKQGFPPFWKCVPSS